MGEKAKAEFGAEADFDHVYLHTVIKFGEKVAARVTVFAFAGPIDASEVMYLIYPKD